MKNKNPNHKPTESISAARSFGQRLKSVRTQLGLDVREISKALGIGMNSYYKYEDGSRFPKPGILQALVNKFQVNLNFLVTGEGPMFIDPGTVNPVLRKLFPGLDPELYSLVEDLQVPVMKHAMAMHYLVEKHRHRDLIKEYFRQEAEKSPGMEEYVS